MRLRCGRRRESTEEEEEEEEEEGEEGGRREGVVQQINFISGLSTPPLKQKSGG